MRGRGSQQVARGARQASRRLHARLESLGPRSPPRNGSEGLRYAGPPSGPAERRRAAEFAPAHAWCYARGCARAHVGFRNEAASMPHPLPSPTSWSFDPPALVGLALLLGGYFVAIGPLRRARSEEAVPARRVALFLGGGVSLAVTRVTPLDTLGRYYLFAAHTSQ